MNFTREPIIETVISAKDGHKLALRNSKGGGQEEFFVDAVEVITFGSSAFYRSLEKPKSFLVPVSDYEVLEVREARMVLKNAAVERVKIGGGKEATKKAPREEKKAEATVETEIVEEQKVEKRRERRRTRKRRTKDEDSEVQEQIAAPVAEKSGEPPSLIPPPSTLISETISRYKDVMIPEESEKKEEESFEEPSKDSSDSQQEAQPQVENDEEIPQS